MPSPYTSPDHQHVSTLPSLLLTILTSIRYLLSRNPLYCFPGSSFFLNLTVLRTFNATVNGRLIKQYGATCYKKSHDEEVRESMVFPTEFMYSNWELVGKLGCPVSNFLVNGALVGISVYIVNAMSKGDTVKPTEFELK
jgi:hypothetical protein